MKEDNLKKLIECEKNAKSMVEEARLEVVKMRNQARIDSQPIIDEIIRVESIRLSAAEKDLKSDVERASILMNEEIKIELDEMRRNLGNIDEVIDFITKRVAGE